MSLKVFRGHITDTPSRFAMHVRLSTAGPLPDNSPDAPLFIRIIELFYLNKLVRQHVIEHLPRAARGPCYFYGSNSCCLANTDVLHQRRRTKRPSTRDFAISDSS